MIGPLRNVGPRGRSVPGPLMLLLLLLLPLPLPLPLLDEIHPIASNPTPIAWL
jgi:hypothetical protein